MNNLVLITGQFYKAEKKRLEHYVVTRIWHLLDDLSVKFITQQYVTRPGGRAMTDMFFPQLHIHIEIDEGHHKKQIEWDKLREVDIINATGHEILRIDVTKDIETVNSRISEIVRIIRNRKASAVEFKPWDIVSEQNPQTYIDKGYIDLKDDCAFRTSVDAANCFGNDYKPMGIWTGGAKHPKEAGKIIWFPKLFRNGKWDNRISNDETEIQEICELPNKANNHIDEVKRKGIYKRIVFARVKGPLGDIMYRFKGEYQLDLNATNYTDGLLWRRISDRVKTYSFK
jgi:very-short-patch-repair endonuclease